MARLLNSSAATIQRKILLLSKQVVKPIYGEFGEEYEVDELCTYFGKNEMENRYWVIYGINKKTNDVIDVSVGKRTTEKIKPVIEKIKSLFPKKIFTDKNNQEKAVQESGLEYCIVRPGGLTVEKPTGVINVIDGEAVSIPRADVAQFCLEAVKDVNFPYVGQTPCISSVGGTSWVKDRSKAARGEQ